jgi:serine/threonine protein kinase
VINKALQVACQRLRGRDLQRDREPAVLDGYARQVEDALRGVEVDLVFSPGSVPIAHLGTDLPVVFWSDATYDAVAREYVWPPPPPPCRRSLRLGHAMESRTLQKCALAIFTSVWAARMKGQRGFTKVVAIKQMKPELTDDPNFETMFLDEASLVSRLRHPNLAEILDLGEEDDVLYQVMEFVAGEPLNRLLRYSRDGVPVPLAVRIVTCLVKSCSHASGAGVSARASRSHASASTVQEAPQPPQR